MALASLFQYLRQPRAEEQRAQALYRARAQSIARRLSRVFEEWAALRELEPDYARLANSAAVNRWELMRLYKEAEQHAPPRSLAGVHRDVQNALLGAARACQLLANGYRFHKSEAVCDGQAMLVDAVSDMDGLIEQLQMRF